MKLVEVFAAARTLLNINLIIRCSMNNRLINHILILCLLVSAKSVSAQCEIKNKVGADGTLYHYIEPVNFYFTQSKRLSGGIVTDEEYYYLMLEPYPFPEKPKGKKLKDSLEVILSNGYVYKLPFYFSNYRDTVFEMLYAIQKADLDSFVNNEVKQVKMDMGDEEGVRTYVFKLHKTALQSQLECFIEEKKGKKEEK